MKTRNLLAATAFATLLPAAAAFASDAEPKTEKQLRCRIGNGKGASYAKGPFECLKARARGHKKLTFEIIDVPVKQEIAAQDAVKKDAPK